jgi:hypothetical protein
MPGGVVMLYATCCYVKVLFISFRLHGTILFIHVTVQENVSYTNIKNMFRIEKCSEYNS